VYRGAGVSDPLSAQFASTTSRQDATAVIELHGELDIAVAAQLLAEFHRLLASDPPVVVVDLRDLSFMDARGLRTLIAMRTTCEQQGRRLMLIRGQRRVHRMLVLCNLVEMFEFVDAAGRPRELNAAPNGPPV
jgi:anti-sigma B factor antagonist